MNKVAILIGILALCLLVGSVAADPPLVDGYYRIGSVSDLTWFATQVNAGHVTYNAKLTADIDLSGVTWTPIGTSSNMFAGTFDGNGHTLSSINGIFIASSAGSSILKNTKFNGGGSSSTSNTAFVCINCECCYFYGVSRIIDNMNIDSPVASIVYGIATDTIFENCYVDCKFSLNGYASLVRDRAVNCYVVNCQAYAQDADGSAANVAVASLLVGNGWRPAHVTNSAVVSGNVLASYSYSSEKLKYLSYTPVVVSWQDAGDVSATNSYSLSSISANTITSPTIHLYRYDGTRVGASTFATESFWHGGSYLNWDFTNTWYWDTTDNLPKLQVFKPVTITSLTLTSPTESPQGSPITAAVVAEGDDLTYQWYTAQEYTPTPTKGLSDGGYGIDGTTVNAGTQSNPYAITDLADLQAISSSNWGANVYYEQTADILLTLDITIGTGSKFIGQYNGNGYKISGNGVYNIRVSSTEGIFENIYITDTYTTSPALSGHYKNCFFVNNNINTRERGLGASIMTEGWSNVNIENSIALNVNVIGGLGAYTYTRAAGTFTAGSADEHSFTNIIKNCVVIGGSVSGSTRNYRIGEGSGTNILTNNYATSGGSSTTSGNGLNIDATQYNSRSWWENTARYDMTSSDAVWEWDSTTNLPKLKHIQKVEWETLTGQTSSQLSYTQAPLGDNYFKVVINDEVDSEAQGFQPLYVHVIPAKPTINSLTLLTTDEIPLGESLRAETNCTNYDGSPISYQWLYSTDNVTYSVISGQTTYQLTYAPPTATLYYIKLIATDKWGSADSIEEGFLPLNTTVFNGIPTNTITSESHLTIWGEHYRYYNDKTLTLGNNLTITNATSVPEFSGTLNGNDHTLINLRQPLITELSGTVKNLKFKDCLISATDYAGLVSATTQTATIENVDADNCNIYSTNSGGITGAVLGQNTLIRNCNVNQCTVIGTAKSAGITPVTQADTAITNVHVTKSDITSPSGYAWGVSP